MQNVIRSSEKRVTQDRKNSEAARLRAFRQNAAVVIIGVFLIGSFAVTNIVLLESVLRSPIGSNADELASSRMGPLMRERVRQQAQASGGGAGRGGGVRDAVDRTWATAARHIDRVKSWVKGGSSKADDAAKADEVMDLDKQERAKLQAMHDALVGRNASAGNASQALKQVLGLVPLADQGRESEAAAPAASSVAAGSAALRGSSGGSGAATGGAQAAPG